MIKPEDIYFTKEEFNTLILDAEAKFMAERAKLNPNARDNFVQFWVNISSGSIPEIYIDELEESYFNAGWSEVEVKFITDRGSESLMVYLVP